MNANEFDQPSNGPESTRADGMGLPHGARCHNRRYMQVIFTLPFILKALLTGAILSVFLYLGTQLASLYMPLADTTNVSPSFLSGFDSTAFNPINVQFGNNPLGFTRQQFYGDRNSVTAHLKTLCRVTALNSTVSNKIPTSTELQLIHSLGIDSTRVSEEKEIVVRSLTRNNPTVVGIKRVSSTDTVNDTRGHSIPHIVAWGFANQQTENSWNLYVISKNSALKKHAHHAIAIDLPPGSRKLMHMHAETGDSVLAFEIVQDLPTQIEFFDNFFSNRGWVRDRQWQTTGKGYHGSYHGIAGRQRETADIHLQTKADLSDENTRTSWGIISVAIQQQTK